MSSDGSVWVKIFPETEPLRPYLNITGGDTVEEFEIAGIWFRRHTFTTPGDHTVESLTESDRVCEVFAVGGGGAGGDGRATGYEAGGGGAGRVRLRRLLVTPGVDTFTVGSGGLAGAAGGSGSVFFENRTAHGGRRGAHGGLAAPSGSGSNGGGAHDRTAGGVTTQPTDLTPDDLKYATNGGTPTASSRGAGGGGALEAGLSNGVGGAGIYYSGTYYAGGGAGMTPGSTVAGGIGGGGRSISGQATGEQGTDGLGGGGGAASVNEPTGRGGRGGNGIIIVTYEIEAP